MFCSWSRLFPSDILFKPQLRMQLKACSCKSDEFRTVSEQNIWFLSLDSRSRRRTQGLLMLLIVDLLHGISISLMYAYAWIPKKRHIPFSTSLPLFLCPYNAKIYISRLSVTTQKSRTPPRSAAAGSWVPWQRRSWRSWTLLIASKRTEPKMIWVNFR